MLNEHQRTVLDRVINALRGMCCNQFADELQAVARELAQADEPALATLTAAVSIGGATPTPSKHRTNAGTYNSFAMLQAGPEVYVAVWLDAAGSVAWAHLALRDLANIAVECHKAGNPVETIRRVREDRKLGLYVAKKVVEWAQENAVIETEPRVAGWK